MSRPSFVRESDVSEIGFGGDREEQKSPCNGYAKANPIPNKQRIRELKKDVLKISYRFPSRFRSTRTMVPTQSDKPVKWVA